MTNHEVNGLSYHSLVIDRPENLLFGTAPHPLKTKRGMLIGGGTVYPELNFTLPQMQINADTMPKVCGQYRQIIEGALRRAVELEAPGVVIEFETLPPMTEHPAWGMEIVHILLEGMQKFYDEEGLKSVFRMTPNDNREFERPPRMREGPYLDAMLELFDQSAAAGSELLSIESVGGKELHDDALVMGDVGMVVFSLCILGVRDMQFLWSAIKEITDRHNVHCAGDTACGFGNTAMVLAEQKMIPRVFAAVVRAISAVRSLVAYECGAVGPGKDCGYENPILKAITGYPMAMEGKSSACAHLSPMGNLAAATCDTWSNESVQNIKLLGGMAPTCFMEQLIYDCRLLNESTKESPQAARSLQSLLVKSDIYRDPQAFIIAPEIAIPLAQAIVDSDNHYRAGVAVGLKAVELMREAYEAGKLKIADNEVNWLDLLEESLEMLPAEEGSFIEQQLAEADPTKFIPASYGL